MKEGATIAFRNGKSTVVDEHIVLEVDRFGKVTSEDAGKVESVKVDNNISNATWEKKAQQK